jgi:DNA-binding NtrC family response regulator
MSDRGRTVLHVSPDAALAQSRSRALASIGYDVISVETVVAALFEISMGRCGILLLCHKLDHTGRCTLAEYFHQNCPDPYIVAVLGHEHDHYPPQAHARVVFSEDPGHLVRVLRQRLSAA